MKKDNETKLQNAWNVFHSSGKVEDYLFFARMSNCAGEEESNADTDGRSDNQIKGYQ